MHKINKRYNLKLILLLFFVGLTIYFVIPEKEPAEGAFVSLYHELQNDIKVKPAKADMQDGFVQKIPETEKAFDMLLVPKGSFMIGSPAGEKGRKLDEAPSKKINLDAFYMAKYEITWDVFELFLNENKPLFVNLDTNKVIEIDAITRATPPYEDPSEGMGKKGYPAINMSAYSALVFCKWLSTVTGRFYRLPTEAEWEYAARAGTGTAYSFGASENDLDGYAVYYNNSNNTYAKVGSKKPNPWGLYDMHGNVAEWTMDEYKVDAYEKMKVENPWELPTDMHPIVYRGGSWDDDADKLRSAARSASSIRLQKRDPQIPKSLWWFTDSNFIGFRLVSPKKQPTEQEQAVFWEKLL
jgi:formylglycine-generating enzyme required for sulfatase activity